MPQSAGKGGAREALVACLDDYLNTLLWLSSRAVEEMRADNNGLLAGGRVTGVACAAAIPDCR